MKSTIAPQKGGRKINEMLRKESTREWNSKTEIKKESKK